MTEPTDPQTSAPTTPTEILRGLVPAETGERRRVFSALLRALTEDRSGRGTKETGR
jgi:hypothetical protein